MLTKIPDVIQSPDNNEANIPPNAKCIYESISMESMLFRYVIFLEGMPKSVPY